MTAKGGTAVKRGLAVVREWIEPERAWAEAFKREDHRWDVTPAGSLMGKLGGRTFWNRRGPS